MSGILSAIIEAWEEIKINRMRIILSLIGVGAAVWAMATTLALGTLMTASQEAATAQWDGRQGTVTVDAYESEGDPDPFGPFEGSMGDGFDDSHAAPIVLDEDGNIADPFGDAVKATVERTGANVWSRKRSVMAPVQAPGYDPQAGCDPEGGCGGEMTPDIAGVDPLYFYLYSRPIIHGRGLTDRDGQLQMNPAVINETLWRAMGNPNLADHPRLRLEHHQNTAFTIVGVVRDQLWMEGAELYVHYDTFTGALPPELLTDGSSYTFAVQAPPGEQENAQAVMIGTLKSQLGEQYTVQSYFDPGRNESREAGMRTVQLVISAIGGIVILLGALGLLTVSIVTVGHRVREIGIRRAMGASARRIFFSVFLESVVATTVAGFIGVLLSILTIRLAPLEKMDIYAISGEIAYPLTAALIGLVISAGVGALCGIIPATIAVRIKPIDAIRF